jgi:hypothetical protein
MSLSPPRLTVILLHPLYAAALVGYIALVPPLLQVGGILLFTIDAVVVGAGALLFIIGWSAITRRSGLVEDAPAASRRFAIGATAGGVVTLFEGLLLITQPLVGAIVLATTLGGLAIGAGTYGYGAKTRVAGPAAPWWPTTSSGLWFGVLSALALGVLLFQAVVPRF